MTTTVAQLVSLARNLNTDEMFALNKALVEMIKSQRRLLQAVVGSSFAIGDVVRFDAKSKGIKHIKIEGFNRARTAVVGREIDPVTKTAVPFATKWTVANTLCVKTA